MAVSKGDSSDPPRTFWVPGTSGWTVKFYTVTAANHLTVDNMATAKFTPDFTFSGTTGSSKNFKFTLPKSLKNQQRYIYMMVTMNGSFEPVGKTMNEIYGTISNGELLFGSAIEFSTGMDKLITLSEEVSITKYSRRDNWRNGGQFYQLYSAKQLYKIK